MFCIIGAILMISLPALQACPDPMTVHIQNCDGAIILHSDNCDQQPRYQPTIGNHYTANNCEPDCTCVSKQNYSPCPVPSHPTPTCFCCTPVYGCPTQYPATNTGSCGCPMLYSAANSGSYGISSQNPSSNVGSYGSSSQYPTANACSCGCCPVRDTMPCGGFDRGYSSFYC
ncbi:unnamed protein product [Chrysodeixis includens]|uniref:Uncharacterized protein n=1 Tax=Chrysodeixis includens TaxID=689277 RepID=A0A9P0BWQ5_CHRIL|nr:unnamed protein product [Chrysodeixis includens]